MRRADDLPRIIADQSRGLSGLAAATAAGPDADEYTPTLTASTTDPNVGSTGSIVGWFHRAGPLVHVWVRVLFDGSGVDPGSGIFIVSLPVAADTTIHNVGVGGATGSAVGSGVIRDDGTAGNSSTVVPTLRTASAVMFKGAGFASVTHDSPFTWAAGDRISFHATYLHQ